jgi:ATP-dependent DNA helicase RecQ
MFRGARWAPGVLRSLGFGTARAAAGWRASSGPDNVWSVHWEEVTFLDVEADRTGSVLEVGAVRGERVLRVARNAEGREALAELVEQGIVAGHNLIAHDLPLLSRPPFGLAIAAERALDTLLLSLLADPTRVSHALDKSGQERPPGAPPDPVADALAARALAVDCSTQLAGLAPEEATFYARLLARAAQPLLAALLGGAPDASLPTLSHAPEALLARLCRVHLRQLLEAGALAEPGDYLALALALRFVHVHERDGRLSGPPSAALHRLPRFHELLTRLLGPLCPDTACPHRFACAVHEPLAEQVLHSHFELEAFRPHQREIVMAVLENRAPLALLPTGGGKSLCYQLPAIHGAERLRGLTVVVSPLQALMADQVGTLSKRYPPSCMLNASLLMEERRQNLAGLRSGRFNIVYMGPEQLRNPSVRRLLQNRPPFLWVIDEAHCVSQWGHGFRTDYTYLPRAIAGLHRDKSRPLLALFTATAAKEVQEDIAGQFRQGMGVELSLLDHGGRRENLSYEVIAAADAQHKDNELENLLSAFPEGARLVYCATVRGAREVQEMLRERGVESALYHGRLAANEKAEQLARFLGGKVATVVATSAFGMGIDKPDIRLVVHYQPSGSLEDYVQETGRAGRDGAPARCVLLYDEADLETQFYLKTISRVTEREVRRVFRALRARARRFSRQADAGGWVELWVSAEDLFVEERLERELDWSRDVLQTKLKLVLYHLEADGACERLENRTRPWGLYPLCSHVEALGKLPAPCSAATRRVLDYLYVAGRPRQISILDVADECGLNPAEAFREVQTLTRLELIGQELSFDVTFARGVPRSSEELMRNAFDTAAALFDLAEQPEELCVVHLRSAAAAAGRALGRSVPPHQIFHVLRALRTQGLLRLDRHGAGRYRVQFDPSFLAARERLRNTRRVAEAVIKYIDARLEGRGRDLAFSLEVERFLQDERRLTERFGADEVVEACLLLHHFEALHLADPPVLLETAMRIRVNTRASERQLDLQRPRRYHDHQIALVHMMREYAVLDPGARERFVADYFSLPRKELVARYFRGRKALLARPVSAAAEARLLEGLSEAQREAVTASEPCVLVMAGPGAGKTHTVVRRVCYLVRARQVRPETILVLAFSRAAARELKERLRSALGERARAVDVRTFHSLALRLTGADVLGERGDADARLSQAVAEAADLLTGAGDQDEAGRAELRQRAVGSIRHVLVDEYQDLDPEQYRLLTGLVGLNRGAAPASERTERSVYVVGDDDQAIYGFRNASSEFLGRFEHEFEARRIFLAENYRSSVPIVEAACAFIAQSPGRMKSEREVMQSGPRAGAGDANSVRRFRYRDLDQVSSHAFYVIERGLGQGAGAIAVLARHWAELDSLRAYLEDARIPFVLFHSDYHRPVHRRHPAERMLRELGKGTAPITGAAAEHVRAAILARGRDPDEPSLAALLHFAHEIDEERREDDSFAAIDVRELRDELLLASRDAVLRGPSASEHGGRVYLSTFHSAKGLEFDKVIVYPTRPSSAEARAEERRLYYVALTRARAELIACTLAQPGELALELPAAEQDLSRTVRRLSRPRFAYLDGTPSDVQLGHRELGLAQGAISQLREGEPLEVARERGQVRLMRGETTLARLSAAGQRRLDKLIARCPGTLSARVHELYVHLTRHEDGSIRRRDLVVIPSFRARAE